MSGEVTTCGDRRPIPVEARGKHLVVDIHCHLGIPAADAIVQPKYPGPPPGINDFTSPKTMEVNRAQFAAIGRTLNTLDTRLADMDRLGIVVQAISPSPGQYFDFTDPATGREAARAVNDGMAQAAAQHPDRLVAMGTVPLQNTEMAVADIEDVGQKQQEQGPASDGRRYRWSGLRHQVRSRPSRQAALRPRILAWSSSDSRSWKPSGSGSAMSNG